MQEMKKTILILFVLATVFSCQVHVDARREMGTISVYVENAPTVEVVTKAEDLTADNFDVYISSDEAKYHYIYKDMPDFLAVPAGLYTVRAENVTEEASLTQPDNWGQIRYEGSSSAKEVREGDVTNFSFTCYVVNTAVSVVFDSSIATYFTDYSVSVFTTEERQLVYNEANTTAENPAVGYFLPGTIQYLFSGTFMGESTPRTIYGTRNILPATHQHLTFKVIEQEGSLGKPEITVDTTIEDFYQSITVDPTEDGNYKTE